VIDPVTVENRSADAAEMLRLGRRLEAFRYGEHHGHCERDCPSRETLAFVFDRLAEIGDIKLLYAALSLYDERTSQLDAARDRTGQQWRERHDEQVRQHQIAITVECPYCGVAPGVTCVTSGPNGKGQTKGSSDHKDRLRAARKILDRNQDVAPSGS
jgi:hypothetical protein